MLYLLRSLSPVSSMSGDELNYVPSTMSNTQANNTLIAGTGSCNSQIQGGSKRFSRRPRAMLDKQVLTFFNGLFAPNCSSTKILVPRVKI